MHILVNHLVRIPTVAQQTAFDEADREDTADALRRYAEDQTECFCDDAFDWRETETAGGWADEYPENVLFAVDDPESFTKRLVEIRNRQKETINWYLGQVMAGCETTDRSMKQRLPCSAWRMKTRRSERKRPRWRPVCLRRTPPRSAAEKMRWYSSHTFPPTACAACVRH